MNARGKFYKAIYDLRDEAMRAFYARKINIKLDIPINIWLKIFDTVIEPIALYSCEVWGLSPTKILENGTTSN